MSQISPILNPMSIRTQQEGLMPVLKIFSVLALGSI